MTVTERVYPSFTAGEMERRHRRLRERMAAAEVDAVVVFGNRLAGGPVQYLSNWPATIEAYVLFPSAGEEVLYAHYYNHVPLARRVSVLARTEWMGVNPVETLTGELRRQGLSSGTIGLVGPMPYGRADALRAALPDVRFVTFDDELLSLRLVKSEEELDWLRRGARLVDLAMEALERELRPGLTEHELAGIVQSAYLAQGGRSALHFMTATPMHDPDVCVPAQYETDRIVQPGDVLLTEIGVDYWGYGGQCLRPYAVGEQPPAELQELYDLAEAAYHAVASALRTGASPEEVVAAADLIEDAGYSICDDLVHGIGGGYHPPVLRTRGTSAEPLPPGFTYPENSTWVIQPNVITPDERMGIQVGDMVRVTSRGAERLHAYPLRFVVCGA